MPGFCVPFPPPARQLDQNPCAATIAPKICKNDAGLWVSKKGKIFLHAPVLAHADAQRGVDAGGACYGAYLLEQVKLFFRYLP